MAEFCEKHCEEIMGLKKGDKMFKYWCCEGKNYPCEQCGYEHLEGAK